MDLSRQYQSNIMLILSAICGVLALLAYLTNSVSEKRRLILMGLEISAMMLMISGLVCLFLPGRSKSPWLPARTHQ